MDCFGGTGASGDEPAREIDHEATAEHQGFTGDLGALTLCVLESFALGTATLRDAGWPIERAETTGDGESWLL
ncbi:MAG: hypothetical protein R3B70_10115 [Polyangiaceae bacterium]